MNVDKDHAIEILASRIQKELTSGTYIKGSVFLIDVEELTKRILNERTFNTKEDKSK